MQRKQQIVLPTVNVTIFAAPCARNNVRRVLHTPRNNPTKTSRFGAAARNNIIPPEIIDGFGLGCNNHRGVIGEPRHRDRLHGSRTVGGVRFNFNSRTMLLRCRDVVFRIRRQRVRFSYARTVALPLLGRNTVVIQVGIHVPRVLSANLLRVAVVI